MHFFWVLIGFLLAVIWDKYDDINKSVYVVLIPRSNQSQHMANDNRYYRKHNFDSIAMEEHEVRDMYNSLQKTDLSIIDMKSEKRSSSGRDKFHYVVFEINFVIKNESNSIERDCKMELIIAGNLIDSSSSELGQYHMLREGIYRKYSIWNRSPIYKDEETNLCPVYIRILKSTFRNPDNFIVKVNLYYSNGQKIYEYDLRDILGINDQSISEDMFV